MTKQVLLDALCAFTKETLQNFILPVQMQEEDTKPPVPRPPDVYQMGLPDYQQAQKKVPYIIHQILTGKDVQPPGEITQSSAVVRSVFVLYHENSQVGPKALLGLIERLRVEMLRQRAVGRQFTLDMREGLDYMIYEVQAPPFYAGEMLSTWILPPVERELEREVKKWL